jgi:hypothetical protein
MFIPCINGQEGSIGTIIIYFKLFRLTHKLNALTSFKAWNCRRGALQALVACRNFFLLPAFAQLPAAATYGSIGLCRKQVLLY